MQQLRDDAQLRRWLLVSVPAAAGVVLLLRRWRRSRRLPPGPSGVPLLGLLPHLDRLHFHEQLVDLSRQYGPVMSYRMGAQLFIVVSSYEMVKEMMEEPRFSGRPQNPGLQRGLDGCGILFSEGPSWMAQRRMAVRTLRDFGFATTRSELLVNEQLDVVCESLDAACDSGRELLLLDLMTQITNSIIGSLTLGVKFAEGDEDFEFLKSAMHRLFSSGSELRNLPLLFPFLDPLFSVLPIPDPRDQVRRELTEFVQRHIRQREQLTDNSAFVPECLCDVYLQEKCKAEAQGDCETFKDKQIVRVVMELLIAGSDTTARSLEWLLIYMALHPEVQERVQQELDSVVGGGRRPRMSDRQQLSFTCATIEESLRIVSLSPMGLFHRAVQDTEYRGHLIPNDAFLIPFVYGVNRDPSLWDQPDGFRPERFLDEDGSFLGSGRSIAFGIGRRSCAGESLARMELLLVFASVAQRYRISVSPEVAARRDEILRGTVGIFRIPGTCPLAFAAR